MSTDWSMPGPGQRCAGCQRRFEPGEALRAHLYQDEAGYRRHDYCHACQPPTTSRPLAVWTTRRREPASGKSRGLDWEGVYRLFEQLEDPAEPSKVQLRFLLGLLLWRKKILRLEESLGAGGLEVCGYIEPRTGRRYRVARPELDENRLEELSAQLEQLLSISCEAAGPEPD